MTKILLSTALVASVALSGCTFTLPNIPGTIPANYIQVISDVQTIAKQICSVEPAAADVLQIIELNNPTLESALQIATAICQQVGHPAVSLVKKKLVPPVVINGVVVHFV